MHSKQKTDPGTRSHRNSRCTASSDKNLQTKTKVDFPAFRKKGRYPGVDGLRKNSFDSQLQSYNVFSDKFEMGSFYPVQEEV